MQRTLKEVQRTTQGRAEHRIPSSPPQASSSLREELSAPRGLRKARGATIKEVRSTLKEV